MDRELVRRSSDVEIPGAHSDRGQIGCAEDMEDCAYSSLTSRTLFTSAMCGSCVRALGNELTDGAMTYGHYDGMSATVGKWWFWQYDGMSVSMASQRDDILCTAAYADAWVAS